MYPKKTIHVIITLLFLSLGCDKTPNDNQAQQNQIELREDFSASEFKEAIVGKWHSVWERPGEEYVKYLELHQQGEAKIIISKDIDSKLSEGNYSINFLRPPATGNVTFAEITIATSNDTIILSRVNFGYHSAFPMEGDLLLRIDEAPYGVLKRLIRAYLWL